LEILMPLQATSGAASYDAFGGGVPVVPNYIEEVFSTYLYTGNGTDRTITNGIDLSTKKGLVWIKARDAARNHVLADNVSNQTTLATNLTTVPSYGGTGTVTGYNTTGFNLGTTDASNSASAFTYASWTFRKQPKFFDVVTYTGNGTNGRTVAHSLGSVPGCMIVKRTDASNGWAVYHRSMNASPQDYMMRLNATDGAFTTSPSRWNNTLPTSTEFTLSGNDEVNGSGGTYVGYLFAHNAGGFGLTGTDNVISCGSFTTDGSGNATVSLGYEPQWLLIKSVTFGGWWITDTMRGMSVASGDNVKALFANTSGAEANANEARPNATGFTVGPSGNLSSSDTFIYIAIRRGPMKVPTSGSSVFAPVLNTGTSTNTFYSSGGFAPDMLWNKIRTLGYGTETWDKLRGVTQILTTSNTSAETNGLAGYDLISFNNTGVTEGANSSSVMNVSPYTYVNYMFGRAPSFFDEVCYTGTEVSGQTFNHNLGAVPEMMIVKSRSGTTDWTVYHSALGASARIYLNATNAANTGTAAPWNSTTPTSSVFSLGNAGATNLSGGTFVNYLFATCAGVSKVGSYTGNGSSQTINCGFTGGARFVLIKKSSGTGDWMVSDSARGIVSGNDPYLELNNTNAEVTGEDWLDTDSTGFVVNEVSGSNANTNGATYIFLAIA
jgi:hypothetical protein